MGCAILYLSYCEFWFRDWAQAVLHEIYPLGDSFVKASKVEFVLAKVCQARRSHAQSLVRIEGSRVKGGQGVAQRHIEGGPGRWLRARVTASLHLSPDCGWIWQSLTIPWSTCVSHMAHPMFFRWQAGHSG